MGCKEGELFVILFLFFLLLFVLLLLVADDILLGLLGGHFTVVFRLPLARSLALLQGVEEGECRRRLSLPSAAADLMNIARVHLVLSQAHTEVLMHALISCPLDYWNALLSGLAKRSIYNLQLLQNSAARVPTSTRGMGAHSIAALAHCAMQDGF